MLNGKKLMCLILLPTFIIPYTLTTPPSTAMQIVEKQVDNKEVLHIDKLGLVKHPVIVQFEKDKEEFKKNEEQKQKDLEKQDKESPLCREFELTFYTSLDVENYKECNGKTSTGSKLFDGVVASNYYKPYTKIQLQGWGEVVVLDRGSDKYFNNDYRLDVFIPREHGESDSHYHARVNKMGKIKVKGTILK